MSVTDLWIADSHDEMDARIRNWMSQHYDALGGREGCWEICFIHPRPSDMIELPAPEDARENMLALMKRLGEYTKQRIHLPNPRRGGFKKGNHENRDD